MKEFVLKPLKVTIPLLLVIIALAAGAFEIEYSIKISSKEVEKSALAEVIQEMTKLQGTIESLIRKGNLDDVRQMIASEGADPNIAVLSLIDEKDLVLSATSMRLIGQPVTIALPEAEAEVVKQVKETMTGYVFLSEDRSVVYGYYPVLLGAKTAELRPSLIGLLYMRYDLDNLKAAAKISIIKQTLLTTAFYTFLFLLLGIFLHFAVTKRASRLVAVAGRLSCGDFSVRSRLRGKDELAEISRAFDRMVDKIEHDNVDLLRESEEKYRAVFETTGSATLIIEEDMTISLANTGFCMMVKYSREEIEGKKSFTEFMSIDDLARLKEYHRLRRINSGTAPTSYEFRAVDGQGSFMDVLASVSIIPGTKKSVASLVDITERKEAEKEVLESKNFLATLLDSIPVPVFYKDIDGRYLGFNRAYEDFFGKTKDELIGKSVFDISPVKLAGIYHAKDVELFERPGTQIYETQVEDARGVLHDVVFYKASTVNFRGKVTGLIGTILDITERKEAETGLQEANQKLAAWVSELEERTAEMRQLSEMGEQLQSCQTVEEASSIGSQYIRKLFPSSQGALYLISPSKDLAEAVKMWGVSPSTEKAFMPLNCWAVRRGRIHLVDGSYPGVLCGHITGPQAGQYLCVPMMSHGEALGILHLNHTAPAQDEQKSTDRLYSEHQSQLVLAAVEHIALAIGNLRLRETLSQQAIRDILTGLFNRRYMEESLARELRRAQREKKSVGVIMFDIDHFKNFNDLFGHDGGDVLLREVGAFLIKSTRGGDIVSRYGGEEFVYVLPGAALEDTRLRAEELRQGVKELQVFHMGKPLGKITISVGVAVFPEYGLTSETILKKADNALYRAKNEGRDQVVVASTIG